MQGYPYLLFYAIFSVGLGAIFLIGEANASTLGDSGFLERELSNVLNSSSDIKPHRGSGR